MGNNIECLEIVLIRASYLDSIDFISINYKPNNNTKLITKPIRPDASTKEKLEIIQNLLEISFLA